MIKFKKLLSFSLSIILMVSLFTSFDSVSFAGNDITTYLTYEIKGNGMVINECDEAVSGNVVIPDTIEGYPVTELASYAFSFCSNMTGITLPESLTTIGEQAFLCCYKLKSITIPSGVTSIGDNAFSDCNSLAQIYVAADNAYFSSDNKGVLFDKEKTTLLRFPPDNPTTEYSLPESTTTIANRAFVGNYNLKKLFFNAALKNTELHSYSSLQNLEFLFVDAENENFSSSENGILFNKNKTELLCYPAGKTELIYNIPYGVTKIGFNAFGDNNNLKTVNISVGLTEIAERAFYNCRSLANINFPEGLLTIGKNAFRFCYALENITLPDSLISIGDEAFHNCKNLRKVSIGKNTEYIGDDAFNSCILEDAPIYLTGFNVHNENEYYSNDEHGVLFNKDKTILIQYPAGNTDKEYIIPDGTEYISCSAFRYCKNQEIIIIPDTVISIGIYAFGFCTKLKNVSLSATLYEIDNFAFYDCKSLKNITIPPSVSFFGRDIFGWIYNSNTGTDILDSDFVINGVAGSVAETYATENGLKFVAVEIEEPTTEEPTTEEPTTEEPTTEEPTTEEPTTKEPETESTTKAPETTTENPVSDKLEVNGDTINVDEKRKTVKFGQKNTAESILKDIRNDNAAVFDKDGKELGKSDLVGTGSEIRVMDNSSKVISTYTVCVPTDVDGNGKTTAADARLALRGSAKLEKVEGVYATASDMNADGKITAADARKILRISAGLEKA